MKRETIYTTTTNLGQVRNALNTAIAELGVDAHITDVETNIYSGENYPAPGSTIGFRIKGVY